MLLLLCCLPLLLRMLCSYIIDVEDDLDDDTNVGVMITRLPEKTAPDGDSAGKLYEVSRSGTGCDTSREVELEKKLDSLQFQLSLC